MQSGVAHIPPEAILQWLFHEMQFTPLQDSNGREHPAPTLSTVRLLLRGNLSSLWHFFLTHVRDSATVLSVRKNLALHLPDSSLEDAHCKPGFNKHASEALIDKSGLFRIRRRAFSMGDSRERPQSQLAKDADENFNLHDSDARMENELSGKRVSSAGNRFGFVDLVQERDRMFTDVDLLQMEVLKMEEVVEQGMASLSKQAGHVALENAVTTSSFAGLLGAYKQRRTCLTHILEELDSRLLKHAQRGVTRPQEGQFLVAGIPGSETLIQEGEGSFPPSRPPPPYSRQINSLLTSEKEEVKCVCHAVAANLKSLIQRTIHHAADSSTGRVRSNHQSAQHQQDSMPISRLTSAFDSGSFVKGKRRQYVQGSETLPGEQRHLPQSARGSSLKGGHCLRVQVAATGVTSWSREEPACAGLRPKVEPGSQQQSFCKLDQDGQKVARAVGFEQVTNQPFEFVSVLAKHCGDMIRRVQEERAKLDDLGGAGSVSVDDSCLLGLLCNILQKPVQPQSLLVGAVAAIYSASVIEEKWRHDAPEYQTQPEQSDKELEKTRSGCINLPSVKRTDGAIDKLLRARQRAHVEHLQTAEMAHATATIAHGECHQAVQLLRNTVQVESASGGRGDGAANATQQELELSLLTMYRRVAGFRAAKLAMIRETDRLRKHCNERRQVQAQLGQVWIKLRQFDAHKAHLMQLSAYLCSVIKVASASWDQDIWSIRNDSAKAIRKAGRRLMQQLAQGHGLPQQEAPLLESFSLCQLSFAPVTFQGHDAAAVLDTLRPTWRISNEHHSAAGDILGSVVEALWEKEELEGQEEWWRVASWKWRNFNIDHIRILEACDANVSEMEQSVRRKWKVHLMATITKAGMALRGSQSVDHQLTEYWEQPGGFVASWLAVEDDQHNQKNATEWRSTLQNLASRVILESMQGIPTKEKLKK